MSESQSAIACIVSHLPFVGLVAVNSNNPHIDLTDFIISRLDILTSSPLYYEHELRQVH